MWSRIIGGAALLVVIAAVVWALWPRPIAVETEAANAQHYEWPAELFVRALGPRLKYSCAWFEPGASAELAAAEERMLALTCERAGIQDGMRILDLGCGWGSFSLWVAERYPNAHVLAVSNSRPQRNFIEARARQLGTHRGGVGDGSGRADRRIGGGGRLVVGTAGPQGEGAHQRPPEDEPDPPTSS